MATPMTGVDFQTTEWSMVLAAHEDAGALDGLLKMYWGPIYAFIRRAGNSPDAAAELTQEFIARVMLERDLISKADPDRGRFRSFLKTAVRNFLTDQHRRAMSRDRAPERPLLSGVPLDALEPSESDDPSGAFDRQWATTLLSMALARVETECQAHGQPQHWAAFKAAVIEPALRHTAPDGLDQVAKSLGLESAEQVSSLIQTVRRKFRRIIRALVEQTLADPADAGDELRRLKTLLGE